MAIDNSGESYPRMIVPGADEAARILEQTQQGSIVIEYLLSTPDAELGQNATFPQLDALKTVPVRTQLVLDQATVNNLPIDLLFLGLAEQNVPIAGALALMARDQYQQVDKLLSINVNDVEKVAVNNTLIAATNAQMQAENFDIQRRKELAVNITSGALSLVRVATLYDQNAIPLERAIQVLTSDVIRTEGGPVEKAILVALLSNIDEMLDSTRLGEVISNTAPNGKVLPAVTNLLSAMGICSSERELREITSSVIPNSILISSQPIDDISGRELPMSEAVNKITSHHDFFALLDSGEFWSEFDAYLLALGDNPIIEETMGGKFIHNFTNFDTLAKEIKLLSGVRKKIEELSSESRQNISSRINLKIVNLINKWIKANPGYTMVEDKKIDTTSSAYQQYRAEGSNRKFKVGYRIKKLK